MQSRIDEIGRAINSAIHWQCTFIDFLRETRQSLAKRKNDKIAKFHAGGELLDLMNSRCYDHGALMETSMEIASDLLKAVNDGVGRYDEEVSLTSDAGLRRSMLSNRVTKAKGIKWLAQY